LYEKTNDLKKVNKELKVLLAVGGNLFDDEKINKIKFYDKKLQIFK
jgi:hypothetical protein